MSGNFLNPERLMPDAGKLWRQRIERENELAGRQDAGHIFDYLMLRIRDFQASLPEDREIGVQLANFGMAAEIHIRSIGYKNPNLIEFMGLDLDKNEVTLIQHISQLSFLLVAVKPLEEKAFRVGFY